MCHVEPGTVQRHRIVYDFDQTEGIVRGLPRILELADRLHIPMGFALTPQAFDLLDWDMAGHDVGLHLHPMDPVLSRRLEGSVKPSHDWLARYSPEQQSLLIAAGRSIYEDRMGREPRLFVAGRWSEDGATAALLRQHGFTHDGSALPGHVSTGADWSRIRRLAQPYSPSTEDFQRKGSEPYLYLPVYQGLWGHYFTPEIVLDVGVSYFKAILDEARIGAADVVHVYFHSPMGLDSRAMGAFEEILEYAHDALGVGMVCPSVLLPCVRERSRSFPPAYWARIDVAMIKSFLGSGELGRRIMDGDPAPAEEDMSTSSGQPKTPRS